MGDINDIIKSVENDEKLRSSRAFKDKVYLDEPILRPASQLKTDNVRPATPREIVAMRQLAYTPEAKWKTSAWLFCVQAESIVDYEDDYVFTGTCEREFPSLCELTSEQLRGYFSWRTKFRKGEGCQCPEAFIKLYAYEVINSIGINSPEEGAELLMRLLTLCPDKCAKTSQLLCRWITDYAALHNISPEKIASSPDMLFDSAVICLMNWKQHSDEELFKALAFLSPFGIEDSAQQSKDPEFYRKAVCRAYRTVAEYFAVHRKNSLADKFFGKVINNSCHLFQTAIYLDRHSTPDCKRTFNEIHEYICKNGEWKCRMIYGNRLQCAKLGQLMFCADSILRDTGEVADVPVLMENLVKKCIQELREERKEQQIRQKAMSFDLSQLDSIRSAADATCEKLLTQEEIEPETPPAVIADAEKVQETPVPAENLPEENALPIDAGETAFLTALLTGGDWKGAAKSAGSLPSLLCDSINDKLFDLFSDTVIEITDDVPKVIEDYADELSAKLKG